jgi:hypothetical protein
MSRKFPPVMRLIAAAASTLLSVGRTAGRPAASSGSERVEDVQRRVAVRRWPGRTCSTVVGSAAKIAGSTRATSCARPTRCSSRSAWRHSPNAPDPGQPCVSDVFRQAVVAGHPSWFRGRAWALTLALGTLLGHQAGSVRQPPRHCPLHPPRRPQRSPGRSDSKREARAFRNSLTCRDPRSHAGIRATSEPLTSTRAGAGTASAASHNSRRLDNLRSASQSVPQEDRLSVRNRWSPRWRPNGLRLVLGVALDMSWLISVLNSQATGEVVELPGLTDMGWDHDDGIIVVGAEHRRRPAAPGIGDAGSSEPGLSRDRRSTYRPAAPTVGTLSRTSLDRSRESVGVSRRLRAGCAQPQTPGVRCPLTQ